MPLLVGRGRSFAEDFLSRARTLTDSSKTDRKKSDEKEKDSDREIIDERIEADIRFVRKAGRKTDDEREEEHNRKYNEEQASSAASTVSAPVPSRCYFLRSRRSLRGRLRDTGLFIEVLRACERASGAVDAGFMINCRLRGRDEGVLGIERLAQSCPEGTALCCNRRVRVFPVREFVVRHNAIS